VVSRPEARRLAGDLWRTGIEPLAWVIDQSLAATETHDILLAAHGRNNTLESPTNLPTRPAPRSSRSRSTTPPADCGSFDPAR